MTRTKFSLEEAVALAKRIKKWNCPHISPEFRSVNGRCVGHLDNFKVILEKYSGVCAIPAYAIRVYKNDLEFAAYSWEDLMALFKPKKYYLISKMYWFVVDGYLDGIYKRQEFAISEARKVISDKSSIL